MDPAESDPTVQSVYRKNVSLSVVRLEVTDLD